ncbi:MAG: acetylxylan esterase [Abitibacteriaceae bacterium]|nr:acetylxylan esterase [Abditibacteriaceae bacterium]
MSDNVPTTSDHIAITDARIGPARTLNSPVEMPHYATRAAWEAHAAKVRAQILVGSGLYPLPVRTPLHPKITGKIEREGYTVEKVLLETMPGFFLGGNLYRPRGQQGPFPGIVSPHGHWAHGRLEDSDTGSIPARCINLARLGFVVFAYDMIGYNDTKGLDHKFVGSPLWGISLQGLQLWDSLRAVDFVASLPDVDATRLGCTGASGGATQTILLTAIDDRIKVSAPVNMISHTMQGGCLCENGPLLRIGTNNMEIGAMMAPRPMLMIAATGDWTKTTPQVEYPAVRHIYRLYGAEEHLAEHQVDAPHNYNRESREYVYAWMVRWLQHKPMGERIAEQPYPHEKDEDLLALAPGARPEGELKPESLVTNLIQAAQARLQQLVPQGRSGVKRFDQEMRPGFTACVGVNFPSETGIMAEGGTPETITHGSKHSLILSRRSIGDRVIGQLFEPSGKAKGAVLMVAPTNAIELNEVVNELLHRNRIVLVIQPFFRPPGAATYPDTDFSLTYNLSPAANQAQDVLTALSYLHGRNKRWKLDLLAFGGAGLSSLVGQSLDTVIGRVAIDCQEANLDEDAAYQHLLFMPSIRCLGGIETALALNAPRPVWLFNAQGMLAMGSHVYQVAGAAKHLRISSEHPFPMELARWLIQE